MAPKKLPSSGRSAPRAKDRLAAFAAQVEDTARGNVAPEEAALVRALYKKEVLRCSRLWSNFAQQVDRIGQQRPAIRLLLPSQELPPLP
ncbi:MAG: hypothetical protein V4724_37725 [Pseudomonadota bacterium]